MQNREIKFRAWIGEEMTDEIRLEAAHGIRLVSSSDLAPHKMSDDKVVFMQFTGLKDKNGKEIYEGDIIKEDVQNEIGSYSEGNLEVYFNTTIGAFRAQYQKDTIHDWSIGTNCEVVGNIFKTPELLK